MALGVPLNVVDLEKEVKIRERHARREAVQAELIRRCQEKMAAEELALESQKKQLQQQRKRRPRSV